MVLLPIIRKELPPAPRARQVAVPADQDEVAHRRTLPGSSHDRFARRCEFKENGWTGLRWVGLRWKLIWEDLQVAMGM